MSDLERLERELLIHPFDLARRAAYAARLREALDYERCLEQLALLVEREPERASHRLAQALCWQRLGKTEQASQALSDAHGSADFDVAFAELTAAERSELPAAPLPRLRVLTGGATPKAELAEIVSIARAGVVRFSDVAGMQELKDTLRLRIIEPFSRPSLFERFKRRAGGGVLLYGPPGCGKTLMARAIASECKASFTSVGISDILNMWVGESERNLASLFLKARSERPAVLFFDELDALAYSRSKANSDHTRTTVNEFLSQLEGSSGQNDGILILGASNMPWDIDDAMKRPGRFDRQVFVPPPDAEARTSMLQMKLRDVPTGEIQYQLLGKLSEHFSGADIDGWIDAAKDAALLRALSEAGEASARVENEDLRRAFEEIQPTTLEWLKTARNLVKFGGAGKAYRDVEKYLRASNMY